jgi:hypothetical protein
MSIEFFKYLFYLQKIIIPYQMVDQLNNVVQVLQLVLQQNVNLNNKFLIFDYRWFFLYQIKIFLHLII